MYDNNRNTNTKSTNQEQPRQDPQEMATREDPMQYMQEIYATGFPTTAYGATA